MTALRYPWEFPSEVLPVFFSTPIASHSVSLALMAFLMSTYRLEVTSERLGGFLALSSRYPEFRTLLRTLGFSMRWRKIRTKSQAASALASESLLLVTGNNSSYNSNRDPRIPTRRYNA